MLLLCRKDCFIMDKNYYEILQIDRNASPEIIEKAYKTLAKKYHPDLQDEAHKKEAEEKFKIINEAYQTLSNPQLKASYDKNILDNNISQEQYEEMYKQNQILKDELNNLHRQQIKQYNKQPTITNNSTHNNEYNTRQASQPKRYIRNLEYERQIKQAIQQAYQDAYIQDLKNRGYKIKYKKTFSDYIKSLISIIFAFLILFILWHIPFIHNYFIKLYNNNIILQFIGDFFSLIFN